jgi:hypothetical protein
LAVRQVLRITSLESLFEMSELECNEQTLGPQIGLELMPRTEPV